MRVSLFLFTSLIIHFASPTFALHIVLDPGHGGSDKGARAGHKTESEITLQISQILAERLKSDARFKVTLTREKDEFVSLEERASKANLIGDLFLSIHVNSSPAASARGHEIYFQNQLPPDEEALFLAGRENKTLKLEREVARTVSLSLKNKSHLSSDVKSIVEDLERNYRLKLSGKLAEELYFNWGGEQRRRQAIRQAPFFVVSNIDKPAALIEIGYLSHPKEASLLTQRTYQEKIADGIYKALINFKDFIDKPSSKSLN